MSDRPGDERLTNEPPPATNEHKPRVKSAEDERIDRMLDAGRELLALCEKLGLRPKPSPFASVRNCILAALLLIGLAAGSWSLGGGMIWGWVAGITGFLLFILTLGGLKVVNDLQARQYHIYAYFVVCWAVWTSIGYFFPLRTVAVSAGAKEFNPSIRITYRGHVIDEPVREGKCSFQVRGKFRSLDLNVELLTPVGWRRFPINESSYGDSVSLDHVETKKLYLDNRDHAAVELEYGEIRLPVKAGAQEHREVLAVPAGEECPLKIDGCEVGTLGNGDFLLDTTGKRVYRWRTVVYGGALAHGIGLDQREPEGEPDKFFVRKHLHQLPSGDISFFLEPAPDKIKVTTFGGIGAWGSHQRTELLEIGE